MLGSQGLCPWPVRVPQPTEKTLQPPRRGQAPLSQTEAHGARLAAFTCVEGGAAVCTIYRVFIIK